MKPFREHGVHLFLDRELYVAFIKLQADRGLGRSYAGLLPFVEGLHQMGYLTQEAYEDHVKRYSKPLIVQRVLPEVLDVQVEQLNKTFGLVSEQWEEHPNIEWRSKWRNAAREHSQLSNARLILQKAGEDRP
jgi:hypothetical protein